MSGAMSKYVADEDVRCFFPDVPHCPVKCMSRSYAHMVMRFQDLEQTMREVKHSVDTVVDYIARENESTNSSESEKSLDRKKAKKKAKPNSRNDSVYEEPRPDTETQATLEKDFTELLTWKACEEEASRPKKPRCQMMVNTKSVSSNDGDSSELENSGDEHPAIVEAGEIVRKVSKVIKNMAKVVDEIQVTAGIAVQVAADAANAAEMANNDSANGSQTDEDEEVEEIADSDPEFVGEFLALCNEMNEVD